MSFKKTPMKSANGREIDCFVGDPDCPEFYAWLLDELKKHKPWNYVPPVEITVGQQGNLGEFIVDTVLRLKEFAGPEYTFALGGSLTPFQSGTTPGLDMVIVYLDPAGDVAMDRLHFVEVKTTTQGVLTYANALIPDYQKLLDTTNPNQSLGYRMSWLKLKLEREHKFSAPMLARVEALSHSVAAMCTQLLLIPTLVHTRAVGDPVKTLDEVAKSIATQGWPDKNILPKSISMRQLGKSLLNLAKLEAFSP